VNVALLADFGSTWTKVLAVDLDAAVIAGRIERADLAGGVRFEDAAADNEKEQSGKEQGFHRHHEMAEGHQDDAKDDDAPLAQNPVRKPAAGQWREIDQARIGAIDQRRQRLHIERTGEIFEEAFDPAITPHMLDMSGKQQIFGQIEDQQRPHAVIGEALPHLRAEEDGKAQGMAKQFAPAAAAALKRNRWRRVHRAAAPWRNIQP